jgi:PAS domain S-box-containing protein
MVETNRTEEDLRDLQNYLSDLEEFLPLAFCLVNPLNLILGINDAFSDLTGYKKMTISGQSLDNIFVDKKIVSRLNKIVQKKKVSLETELLTHEGERIPVQLTAMARRDDEDEFLGYFLTISDISEVKKYRDNMEEQVQRQTKELSESRLALLNILEDTEEARRLAEEERSKTAAIIRHLSDGLLFFDKNHNLALINPLAEEMFQVKAEDVLGLPVDKLKKLQNLFFWNKKFKELFREELSLGDIIYEVTTSAIDQIGTLVVFHDISREKLVERMKSEFVSIAAHQLRTPLSAIKWTIRMILDGDTGEVNNEQKEMLEKTYVSNERMVALINDLLNVTRIEEGRYLYQQEKERLDHIVRDVLDSSQELAKKKKLKMDIDLDEVTVTGDQEKLRLAVQNLTDNAIKYTPEGGQVTISLKKKDGQAEFNVTDTGVGIPKNQQERLFGKFFRAENVIRMETEGSGLGLFITKNVITAHKGKIWFKSEEGKGSTFSFSLPMVDLKRKQG